MTADNFPLHNFPPPVEFAFVLNLAEGLTSIETNLKSGFLCIWSYFVFSPTTVNGTCDSDVVIFPPITTYLFQEKENSIL